MTKILMLLVLLAAAVSGNAAINIFTDHQVITMFSDHAVNQGQDVRFKTGDYPYIGRIGLEYERKNFSYQLAYIHRSNVDVASDEDYYYSGVSFGVKAEYCFADC